MQVRRIWCRAHTFCKLVRHRYALSQAEDLLIEISPSRLRPGDHKRSMYGSTRVDVRHKVTGSFAFRYSLCDHIIFSFRIHKRKRAWWKTTFCCNLIGAQDRISHYLQRALTVCFGNRKAQAAVMRTSNNPHCGSRVAPECRDSVIRSNLVCCDRQYFGPELG